MNSEQARELLHRYRLGLCTDEEAAAVEEWYETQANTNSWEWSSETRQLFYEGLQRGIQAEMQEEDRGVFRIGGRRIAVAACVILLVGVATAYVLSRQPKTTQNIPATELTAHADVSAPASSHATITLAGGRQIVLDSAGNGQLATEGNMQLVKNADGQLVYNGDKTGRHELLYNILTVPRGSRIVNITLSDGTKVWLNSESSLRYPVAFSGKERSVEVSGEAYFEVAKNAASPFLVRKIRSALQVQVLGTRFDINSYEDDKTVRVTLLEGSVRVKNGSQSSLLTPGLQAEIGDEIRIRDGVNTDAVMAWKNGYFHFEQADIKTVMRELARWYDLDVKYEGTVPDRRFGGEMDRDLPLSGVLRLLQQGEVHYRVEGKRVTIMP